MAEGGRKMEEESRCKRREHGPLGFITHIHLITHIPGKLYYVDRTGSLKKRMYITADVVTQHIFSHSLINTANTVFFL